jgi:plastocyanin
LRKIHTVNVFFMLLALAALILLPLNAFAGRIKGTVEAQGLRTPENVVVYLAKMPQMNVDLSKTKFVMDQRNLEFVPHVLPVPVGSSIVFPNNDQVAHNVFSMSRTKTFNLGSYKPDESKTVVFDKAGIVELRCDVHAEMSAYILVMKNPYFAVTDKNGNFEIPDESHLKQAGIEGLADPAPGKYVVKTWHEKLKTRKTTVVVPENGDVTVDFKLKRGTPGVLYK